MKLVKVVFALNDTREFSYLCDLEDINVNDYVKVFVGDNNQEKTAIVKSIEETNQEYLDQLPYKLKSIVRKMTQEEIELKKNRSNYDL